MLARFDKVAASLREFGFRQPIVVDENYTVYCWLYAIARREETRNERSSGSHRGRVDRCTSSRRIEIADNRTNEEAEWDIDLLKVEFQRLAGSRLAIYR
jgi:hypothetical protein